MTDVVGLTHFYRRIKVDVLCRAEEAVGQENLPNGRPVNKSTFILLPFSLSSPLCPRLCLLLFPLLLFFSFPAEGSVGPVLVVVTHAYTTPPTPLFRWFQANPTGTPRPPGFVCPSLGLLRFIFLSLIRENDF